MACSCGKAPQGVTWQHGGASVGAWDGAWSLGAACGLPGGDASSPVAQIVGLPAL